MILDMKRAMGFGLARLTTGVAFAAVSLASSAKAQACGAATDTTAKVIVANMRHLSGSTDLDDGYTRRDLSIPAVDTSTITLVQQSQTCQKILTAFNATLSGVSPLPTKIYAVKVGTVYVAMSPSPSDHYQPYAVIDSKFKVVSKFAQ